jgi:hypothetical protein
MVWFLARLTSDLEVGGLNLSRDIKFMEVYDDFGDMHFSMLIVFCRTRFEFDLLCCGSNFLKFYRAYRFDSDLFNIHF